MSNDGQQPGGFRGPPLKTKPIDDDSNSLRAALQSELRKSVAPSILVVAGEDVGVRVKLAGSIEIGRDPVCEVPLRDENVSWRHVRVEDRGNGDWVAVDLKSTNGMMVNGDKCAEALLRRGDRIFVGRTILEFQEHDALSAGYSEKIDRLLSVDDLSGLWVKRRFDTQLATTVAAVQSGALACVSVIVMDMDGIKSMNDTHGHDMGAFAIGTAGHLIGSTLAARDARAFGTRFGGDEFAAALPGVNKDDALAIAEAIRMAVVEHVYEHRGIRVQPGLSCGVAAMPDDAPDADGVFRAADQAMYRAKRGGKNRVSV